MESESGNLNEAGSVEEAVPLLKRRQTRRLLPKEAGPLGPEMVRDIAYMEQDLLPVVTARDKARYHNRRSFREERLRELIRRRLQANYLVKRKEPREQGKEEREKMMKEEGLWP